MHKEIRIAVKAADLVPLDRLRVIQDELKSLSKENYNRLRAEILEKGFSFAFHVWDDNKTLGILDGTQRYRVLTEMVRSEGFSIPGVPVNYVEAKSEREAVTKLLGGAGMYGQPEDEGLYALMVKHNITMSDIQNISLPGIDLPTFEMNFFKDEVSSEGEDEIPEPPKEAKTKPGEVWILGDHRLLCGDSTKREDVERLMGGEKADMVFTDPPYGIDLNTDYSQRAGGGRTFRQIESDNKPFDAGPILEIFNSTKEIFLWGPNNYCHTIPNYLSGVWGCWEKKDAASDTTHQGAFELWWSKVRHRAEICRVRWLACDTDKDTKGTRVHPTQKPVALAEWFFEKWGKDARLITDLFLGSGSTLIACEKTNRRCFGMEIDPIYCDVIISRWEKFSGKRAAREDGTSWAELRGT